MRVKRADKPDPETVSAIADRRFKETRRRLKPLVLFFLIAGPIIWFILPNLHKMNPMYKAVVSGETEAVADRLKEHPGELDRQFSSLSASPLHVAVSEGDIKTVNLLLDNGADIQAPGYRHDETPLHVAAGCGYTDITELLIQRGANVNARNMIGETPLHSAASKNQVRVIRILLDNGANINARDEFGKTPLGAACEFENVEAAEELLENGAKDDLDALVKLAETELLRIPLASKSVKNRHRKLISLLKKYNKKSQSAPGPSGP